MKTKFAYIITAALLLPEVSYAENLVADPARAYSIQWKTYPRAGRDFYLLLNPRWLKLKGDVPKEAFVQQSGTAFSGNFVMRDSYRIRNIAISEVECLDEKNAHIPCSVTVLNPEKETVVQDPEALTDKNPKTDCVISGALDDTSKRYQPLTSRLQIRSGKTSVKQILIRQGNPLAGFTEKVTILSPAQGKVAHGSRLITVTLEKPASDLTLELKSPTVKYSSYPFDKQLVSRLKAAPFLIRHPIRLTSGTLAGLTPDNMDFPSFQRMEKAYKDTFLGYEIGEWDSNFLNCLSIPASNAFKFVSQYIKLPCSKEGMILNMKKHWDKHAALMGEKISGMCGMQNFEHLSCDFGSNLAIIEITSEHVDHQHRNNYAFLRGASRQFEVPMSLYYAYFLWDYTSIALPYMASQKKGMDFGAPPSLGLRNFYMAYYMGCNYIELENQPESCAYKTPSGEYKLSGNGKALKDIHEWTRKPEGKRGNPYAPVMLLADRTHGYDAWRRYRTGWSPFYKKYPLLDDDLMLEYAMQSFNPDGGYVEPERDYLNSAFIGNLRNSTLGDLFDVYIANPLVKGEIRSGQLARYPVIMLTDDITWTGTLATKLKKYVSDGGTLILTAGHIAPFMEDESFLGCKALDQFTVSDSLKIRRFALGQGTKVMMKTSNGTPLVLKNTYGNGNVLLITSPFMKKTSRIFDCPQALRTLLEKIQAELLPFRIEGDCQFLCNVMPDGVWKVILINNRGIVKAPWKSEERFDNAYTRHVKVVTPAHVSVKEVRSKAKLVQSMENGSKVTSLDIPPAGIMVLELEGVKAAPAKKKTAHAVKPALKKSYASLLGKQPPHDGFDLKIRKGRTIVKTPEIIGSWKASEGYRDVTHGHNLQFKGAAPGKNLSQYGRNDNFYGTVTFSTDYLLPESTWSIWVKTLAPEEYRKTSAGKPNKRYGILYSDSLMLEINAGCWAVTMVDRSRVIHWTSKTQVKEGWNHVAITWKNNFCRLYINGEECKNEKGPLRFLFSRDIGGFSSFSNRISFVMGRLGANWPANFNFVGELGDFIWYGKALDQKAIAGIVSDGVKK